MFWKLNEFISGRTLLSTREGFLHINNDSGEFFSAFCFCEFYYLIRVDLFLCLLVFVSILD